MWGPADDQRLARAARAPMDWVKEGPSWPNHEQSRFVSVRATRWHLQQMGQGDPLKPDLLLLHGAGATTHSYADLMPLLAKDFKVTALDLPGHGFTTMLGSGRPNRQNVAQGISALLQKEEINPRLIVGHSAGAAVAVQLVADGLIDPAGLVSMNGSFYPFPGMAQHMFPVFAKLLFYNPIAPRVFASGAKNPKRINKLIESTGSQLTEAQIALYRRAFSSSTHVEGTLEMMANWDLVPMAELLKSLQLPVLQIIGSSDGTVKPSAARKTATLLQSGQLEEFEGYGHLVHEEIPAQIAETICRFAKQIEVI